MKIPINFFTQLMKKEFSGWKQGEKVLFFLLLANIIYCLYFSLRHLFLYFPSTYMAGELLISYAGGMIRRGLIGTCLSFFPSSKLLVPTLVICIAILYITFLICIGKVIFKTLERPWAIILIGSPGIFLFACYDNETIARKDLIIAISQCLLLYTAVIAKKHLWNIAYTLTIFTIIYIPAFLSHELTLFFTCFPLAILWGLYKTKGERLIIFLYAIALIGMSAAFAFLYKGDFAQRDAILAYWQSVFPDLKTNAIDYIGLGLTDRGSEHYAAAYLKIYSLRISIIKAWILALLPIAAIWIRYNINRICVNILGKFTSFLFYLQAALVLTVLMIIMNDIGRIISLFAIVLAASALALISLHKNIKSFLPEKRGFLPDLDNRWIMLGVALYLFCWKLEPWVPLSDKTFLSPQFWQEKLLLGN